VYRPVSARVERYIRLVRLSVVIGAPLAVIFGVVLALDYSATTQRLQDAFLDYMVGFVWAMAILASIAIWPVPRRHRAVLMILWTARIGVTLGAMLFYEGYYGLDSAYYYAEGLRQTDPWEMFEFGQGTDNIIALVALHNQIFPASFHGTKVTCSLLGLVAVYLTYRAACLYQGKDNLPLLYLLGLFPSIVFWGSILGKDPITLFGIAIFIASVVGFTTKGGGLHFIVWGALGIVIAASMRMWLAVIFLAPLIVVLLFGRIKPFGRILLLGLTLVAGTFVIGQLMERFAIETTEDLLITADVFSQVVGGGGSALEIEGGFRDWEGVAAFLPWAAFTILFRPIPGEVMNPFGLLAGAENAVLLWLLYRVVISRNLGRLAEPLVAWAVLTIVFWATVYAIFAYQNLGMAFRFKLQVMPLLVLLLLYLGSRPERRNKSWPQSSVVEHSKSR
jgi:hypothetical protein